MNQSTTINYFVILGAEKVVTEIFERLKSWRPILIDSKQTICMISDVESCIQTAQSLNPNTSFRVWVHLLYQGATNKKSIPTGIEQALLLTKNGIKVNYYTRASRNDVPKILETILTHQPHFDSKIHTLAEIGVSGLVGEDILENSLSTELASKQNLDPQKKVDLNIDILVVNAINAEFIPLLDVFNIDIQKPSNFNISKLSQLYHTNFVNEKGETKSIGFIKQPEMGMVDASIITTQAIEKLKPKLVVMTGVCGGKKTLDYGDVIIPRQSFTFQFGKFFEQEKSKDSQLKLNDSEKEILFVPTLQTTQTNSLIHKFDTLMPSFLPEIKELVNKNSNLRSEVVAYNNDLESQIKVHKQNKNFEECNNLVNLKIDTSKFNIHISDDMACSTSVIDVPNYFSSEIVTRSRNAKALEMESYAIGRSCDLATIDVKSLIIKSVMDKTEGKSETYKSFAAYTSAYTLYYLMKKGYL